MAWKNQGVGEEGKQFLMNAVEELPGIALLKVGSATASNEQGIPSEYPVIKKIADTALGMARRMENLEGQGTHLKLYPIRDQKIGTEGPGIPVDDAFASYAISQKTGPRYMVGMHMGFHGVDQAEIQIGEERDVPLHFTQNGVNQNGPPRALAPQQVAVGRGIGLKKLAKDHGRDLKY